MSATSTASRPRPTIDAADARRVVARVEGVPAAVEVGLEPGREVHRLGGRRRLDVRDVAEHVAGRDVQRPAEGDGEVRVVATDALAGPVGVGGRRPRVGRARHPGQVAVDEVDDGLHPAPARRQVPEALPGLVAELVGQAEAAGHDEAHDLVGQRRDRHLRGAGLDHVGRGREGQLGLVGDPRVAGGDPEALAAVAVEVDIAVVVAVGVPRLAAHAHARAAATARPARPPPPPGWTRTRTHSPRPAPVRSSAARASQVGRAPMPPYGAAFPTDGAPSVHGSLVDQGGDPS